MFNHCNKRIGQNRNHVPDRCQRMFSNFRVAFLALAWLMVGNHFLAAQDIAITGAKIIPIVGDVIENGTIVIRDGRITAIGAEARVPVEARVIKADGKVVVPGFIDPHNAEGMSQANENNPNVPFVSVLDTIDPLRPFFDEARRNGITTVCVSPANSTMIGGQTAVIKTGATFLDDMILQRQTGIKISLSSAAGVSRMGQLAALRKELSEAKKLAFPEEKADVTATAKPEAEKTDTPENQDRRRSRGRPENDSPAENGKPGPTDDPKPDDPKPDEPKAEAKADAKPKTETKIDELKQPMVDLVSGKLLALIHCEIPMDVDHALKLIEDFNLKPVLILGRDCYKAADAVIAAGHAVILPEDLVFWERDPRTNRDSQVNLIGSFRNLNAPVAFSTSRSSSDTIGQNYLWYQAALAVKNGLPRDKALAGLTFDPARMLGIDEYVGSLEIGKDGDLLILSGDPLDVNTWVETTVINGRVVYERSKDRKLEILLKGNQ